MKIYRKIQLLRKHIVMYFFILILVFFCNNMYLLNNYNGNYSISFIDLIISPEGNGILSEMGLVFPIMIVYLMFVMNYLELDNNIYIMIRHNNRRSIWKNEIKSVVLISLVYSIIIEISSIIVSYISINIIGNQVKGLDGILDKLSVNGEVAIKIGYTYIALVLGCIAIGSIIAYLKMMMKSKLSYLVISIFLLCDILTEKYSIVIGKMCINLNKLANPRIILLNFCFLTMLSFTIYFLGKDFIKSKEFLINKI